MNTYETLYVTISQHLNSTLIQSKNGVEIGWKNLDVTLNKEKKID